MQEGHAFMVATSDHVEELITFIVTSVVDIKYKKIPKDFIEAERPSITVPKKFNLTSAQSLYNRLKDAGTNNMPDSVKLKWVKQLIEKESGINSDDYLLEKAKQRLDPFPAYTFQQKVLARDTLSDLKYVLTMNIDAILMECIEENTGFLLLDYKEQKLIVDKKAGEFLAEAKDNLNKDFTVKPATNIVSGNAKI